MKLSGIVTTVFALVCIALFYVNAGAAESDVPITAMESDMQILENQLSFEYSQYMGMEYKFETKK